MKHYIVNEMNEIFEVNEMTQAIKVRGEFIYNNHSQKAWLVCLLQIEKFYNSWNLSS